MAYEYKIVPLKEQLLNDYGQAYWEAVGSAGDGVLLRRDSSLDIVVNGLRDHPHGTLLTVLVVEPVVQISLEPIDCYESLSRNGFGRQVRSRSFGSSDMRGDSPTDLEFLEFHTSGRVVSGQVEKFTGEGPPVLHALQVAKRVMKLLETTVGILTQRSYSDEINAILTMSGLRGCMLKHGQFSDSFEIDIPFVQFSRIPALKAPYVSANQLARDFTCMLFERLGWPYNPLPE